MKDTPNPEADERSDSFSCGAYLIRIMLAVILLLLSFGFFVGGGRAIQQQRYEIKWRAIRTVGFLAAESHGVSQYRGTSAVRMGIGNESVAILLATGAVFLLSSPDWRRAVSPVLRVILLILGWLSFCALLLACGCFFPPWQLESISFYGVVVLLTGVVTVLRRPARERWGKRLGIALIVGAIVVGFFRVDLLVGMALGMFVFFVGFVHLALLVSPIRRALEEPPS